MRRLILMGRMWRLRKVAIGEDVAFAGGRYAPSTGEGGRLLAHEFGPQRTAKLANYGRPQWGFALSAGPRVRGTFSTKSGIRA